MRTTFLAFTLIASSAFAQDSAHPSTPLGATLSLSKGQGTPAPQAAAPAAQVDSRFAAWLGCWRLDDDLAGTGARMCITPDNGGVRLQTVIGTQKGIDELVIPDGVARPITDAECKGTERADWSKDGARVFRTTEVTCGKEPARTIKAAVFMAPGPTWINVQHISGQAANTSVRVQRYRRSANQTLADGSRAPQPDLQLVTRTSPETTTWSIADVIDASGYLPLEAMQAVLTEVHHPFDLNKKTLVTLADGGVTDQVIDLMVALTYPKRFVVERPGGASTAGLMTGGGFLDPFMTPLLMGSFADCYTPFGYGYRSYYSMCGSLLSPYSYNYYGLNRIYYPGGYYYGGWVNLDHQPGVIGSIGPQEQIEGRVIRGQGFTQIRHREADPSPRINAGSNGGAWSGASGGGASAGSGFSSGSSHSSGGGGSSGGDSGARVAVPKGGGQ